MPTDSASSAPHESMDASVARRTALEMAALTRVLFGVTVPRQIPIELGPPPAEAPAPSPEQLAAPAPKALQPPTQVTGLPVPQEVPVPQAEPSPALAPVAPTSIPLPEIPADTSEPARETQRRPVGPSLELLQEIAFLDE